MLNSERIHRQRKRAGASAQAIRNGEKLAAAMKAECEARYAARTWPEILEDELDTAYMIAKVEVMYVSTLSKKKRLLEPLDPHDEMLVQWVGDNDGPPRFMSEVLKRHK